jgi:hypothetical protein
LWRLLGQSRQHGVARPVGWPRRHADAPAGATDSGQLGGNDLVTRREDGAEARQDDVARGRGDGQALGVAEHQVECDARGPDRAVRRASSNHASVMSTPTTAAPALAAATAALPDPVATSSARSPGATPTRATSMRAAGSSMRPIGR